MLLLLSPLLLLSSAPLAQTSVCDAKSHSDLNSGKPQDRIYSGKPQDRIHKESRSTCYRAPNSLPRGRCRRSISPPVQRLRTNALRQDNHSERRQIHSQRSAHDTCTPTPGHTTSGPTLGWIMDPNRAKRAKGATRKTRSTPFARPAIQVITKCVEDSDRETSNPLFAQLKLCG